MQFRTPINNINCDVLFMSGVSSVGTKSKSKSIGTIQYFTGLVKIKSIVKPANIILIEFGNYICTPKYINPHRLHEAIGVSIGMNSPPFLSHIDNIFFQTIPNSLPNYYHSINYNQINNHLFNCEFSVVREENF